MKFSIEKTYLNKAVAIAAKVCSKGPVDSRWIGVTALGNTLTIQATDMKRFVTITLTEFYPNKDGEAWFPADVFSSVIAKMPEGEDISIGIKGDRFSIDSPGMKVKILPRAEPLTYELPTIEKQDAYIEIPPPEFIEAIAFTTSSVAKDYSKQVLTGINIARCDRGDHNTYTFASTDGSCLSVVNWPGDADIITKAQSVTVDASFLESVCQAVSSEKCMELTPTSEGKGQKSLYSPMLKLAIGGETAEAIVEFPCYKFRVVGRVFIDPYPEYQRIVPTGSTCYAHFEASDLHKALDRVSVFSERRGGQSIVEFAFLKDEGLIEMTNCYGDGEEIKAAFPAEFEGTPPLKYRLKSRYVKGAVKQKGELTMAMVDYRTVCLFTNRGESSPMLVAFPLVSASMAREIEQADK